MQPLIVRLVFRDFVGPLILDRVLSASRPIPAHIWIEWAPMDRMGAECSTEEFYADNPRSVASVARSIRRR